MTPEDQEPETDGSPTDSPVPEGVSVTECSPQRIDPAVLELDHVFTVLSHPRRRYLVYALAENPEWTLPELATELVAWEEGREESEVETHRRDQMYVSLYHTQVPKLVDEGVVEFDEDTETIERGDNADQVFAVLAGAGGSLDLTREQHESRRYDGNGDE